MSNPYVGEIRIFAGNFAPNGWMTCDGQLLAIADNDTLFNLIGTTYGGDGVTTFALPNLAARLPIHMGSNGTSTYSLASNGGVTNVTLTTAQLPTHTHPFVADSSGATGSDPTNAYFANASPAQAYSLPGGAANPVASRPVAMNAAMLGPQGGGQPHDNMQPYLALTYIISHFSESELKEIMADAFVAEIRIFPFNFAPKGWALCNGQLLPISQNTALFSLLGTTYGGDGRTNFALPNLQGAAGIHTTQYSGNSQFGQFALGQTAGSDTVTLLASQMPAHTHTVTAEGDHRNAQAVDPTGAVEAYLSGHLLYSTLTTTMVPMNPAMVSVAGGSQPHNNLMPYLVMNYCIAMQGIFPPRS